MTTETTNDQPLVLITGGSGLIGSRLISEISDDYVIVALDIEAPQASEAEANFIECDLTADWSVEHALEQVRNEYGDRLASIVHLAAYYDFSGEPSSLYRELTVMGTQRLLFAIQDFQVEQFLFSSSLLVMASAEEGELLSEESPIEAEWDYPRSKLAAEKTIRDQRGEIPAVILRIAGVYDDMCLSIPIAQQIGRIYEKQLESYFFPGDTDHGQAFVHLDDLVQCIRKTIDLRSELGSYKVLLIGEEDVMSYDELQDRIGELVHGKQWPTIRIPKVVAKAGAWAKDKLSSNEKEAPFIKPWMIDLADQNYPVQITRAREMLAWNPQHTLRETLEPMIENLKRDPHGWYSENGLPIPDEIKVIKK